MSQRLLSYMAARPDELGCEPCHAPADTRPRNFSGPQAGSLDESVLDAELF